MSAGQEDEVGMETEKLEYMEVNMAFDFKKEYKEFYMPKNKPEIVTIPKILYLHCEVMVIPMKRVGRISRRLVYYMLLHTH